MTKPCTINITYSGGFEQAIKAIGNGQKKSWVMLTQDHLNPVSFSVVLEIDRFPLQVFAIHNNR